MEENKYPSIKFTKEAWERILPIVREWGCKIYNYDASSSDTRIVSNFGNERADSLIIGTTGNESVGKGRYLVDTEDEFLSVVAKLAGKVYSSSKSSASSIVLKRTNKVTLDFNV